MKIWRLFKKGIIVIVILVSLILIGYEFESFRNIIKTIIVAIFSENIAKNINMRYIEFFRVVLRNVLYTGIVIMVINYLITDCFNNKERKFEFGDNLFNKALYNYLKSSNKRCFLVSGDWGAGKTYKVRNFIDKYLPYREQKAYYISCFGIDTRSDLINQLKDLYEKEDNSLKLQIAEAIRLIPIVGELLYKILKPKYEFKDMAKKSIFVFDDFERVTPILNDYNENTHYRYRNYTDLIGNTFNKFDEFTRIKEEFEKIENEFSYLRSIEEKIIRKDILSKYNIITGLINELVDIYEMKVIVVCNSEIIDNRYYRDIFDGKLECIRFKVNYLDIDVRNLAKDNIERYVSLEYGKKDYLYDFFAQHGDEIKETWQKTGIKNTRILSGIILAFINFIDEIDLDRIIEKDISFFYSIFVAHISYNNPTKVLSLIRTGESLLCYDKKYSMEFSEQSMLENRNFTYLESIKSKESITWCGMYISLSWLIGTHLQKNIIINEIDDMNKYNKSIEKYLVNEKLTVEYFVKAINEIEKVNIDDLLIGIRLTNNKSYEYSVEIERIFKTINIDFEQMANVMRFEEYDLKERIFVLLDRAGMLELFEKNNNLKNIILEKLYSVLGYSVQEKSSLVYKNSVQDEYIKWINLKSPSLQIALDEL